MCLYWLGITWALSLFCYAEELVVIKDPLEANHLVNLEQLGTLEQVILLHEDTIAVPVNNYQPDQIKQALTLGLEYLIRHGLSDHNLVTSETITQALNQPEKYLVQYKHQKQGEQQWLVVKFSLTKINQLLQQVSGKAWLQHRANVLLWLISLNDPEKIVNINQEQFQPFIQKFTDLARQHNVKVIFPLWDFQDQMMLQGNDLMRLNLKKIREASQRYGTPIVIIGYLDNFETENWRGRLLLLHERNLHKLELKEQVDLDNLWEVLIDTIASNKMAIANELIAVPLVVKQVYCLEECESIIEYLNKLDTLIKKVTLVKATDQELGLLVEVIGGETSLRIILENQNKLTEIVSTDVEDPSLIWGEDGVLTYYWH